MPEASAAVSGEPTRGAAAGITIWIKGLAPLILIATLVFTFLRYGPLGIFQQAFPPVEELTVERITLPRPGEMRVRVVNGGPEPVTIAQVLVDDAAWAHDLDGSRTIRRLEGRTITIPYPWAEGEPHEVVIVTSTGLTFSASIAVATQSPSIGGRYLATFALLGIYVGVIPVFLGLLWLPFLRAMRRRWIDFFLSLTIGLLIFLGVDALAEALDIAALVPGAFQGHGLLLIGALGTPLALAAIGKRKNEARGASTAFRLATLIALGIGLHNLGEGLIVGSAYATGEIALGTLLVVGFLLHNTTEGLGIVAPIARERVRLRQLILLGALAGVPTVLGAWIGGFSYSPALTTLLFAVGAGAIAQVVYQLWKFTTRSEGSLADPLNAGGLVLGLVIMYATGLFVAA